MSIKNINTSETANPLEEGEVTPRPSATRRLLGKLVGHAAHVSVEQPPSEQSVIPVTVINPDGPIVDSPTYYVRKR